MAINKMTKTKRGKKGATKNLKSKQGKRVKRNTNKQVNRENPKKSAVARPRRSLVRNQTVKEKPPFKFAKGERVLCFHGPLIYEAKALKSSVTKDKQIKYYIHYAGWNKNWDEWVPENRVLKYNEENVQRQREIDEQHKSGNKGKKAGPKGKRGEVATPSTSKDGGASSGGSESRASTPSKELSTASLAGPSNSAIRGNRAKTQTPAPKEGEPNNKRDRDDAKDTDTDEPLKKKRLNDKIQDHDTPPPGVSEKRDVFLPKVEVKIKIPDELKIFLTEDWDSVVRNQRLLAIPAKITVQDIIDEFLEYKKSLKLPPVPREFPLDDVFLGVAEYFNVLLGSQLLYKSERPQYDDVRQQHPDTPNTKLYGGQHLLRLFVKMGGLLALSGLDEEGMQAVLVYIHEFLRFIARNASNYLDMDNYYICTPDYLRRLA